MPELSLPFFYLVTSKNSDKCRGRHSESKSKDFFLSCSFTVTCLKDVDQRRGGESDAFSAGETSSSARVKFSG